MRTRSEIPEQYRWNAPSVFTDSAAWEAAGDDLLKLIEQASSYKDRLSEGPLVLADFMQVYEQTMRLGMKIFFYAAMSANCDSTDKQAAAMNDKARSLMGQAAAAVAFAQPEMLAIGRKNLERWMDQEPRLSVLRHYVDNLFRQQAHVRSAEVEQVMGLAQDPFGGINNIFSMLVNADLQFAPAVSEDSQTHDVAQGTYPTLLHNADREIRRSAYDSYTGSYLDFKNTLAASYITSVKQDVFNMRVRGYESSLAASLFQNNVPVAVHDTLIETYRANIATWHKYWRIRRQILGVDALHPYDIWAPLTDKTPEVPYTQAVDWISEGMAPLGEDYVQALRQGCLQDRWVDVYPNKGKRQGAFSFGTHDTFPFIMMSYDDTLSGLSTLAHELGHSMHSYHSRKAQPYFYSRYTLFVAEVASNFNQALVRAHLRQKFADDTIFQINLIEEAMGNFHRYFFIMPTLARFELEVHNRVEKGQGLTAEDLNELCADLFSEGYGDEMHIDHDRVGITWATFQHLYSNFYVYQYATGISAAHALAEKILSSEDGAVSRYIDFLSTGGALYPLDALNRAGVDMTKPDAVETTFGVLADMVDRLEQLAGV